MHSCNPSLPCACPNNWFCSLDFCPALLCPICFFLLAFLLLSCLQGGLSRVLFDSGRAAALLLLQEREDGQESLAHDASQVARDVSLEMRQHMAALLESNLGQGQWADEVASAVAAPLDAMAVYAPRSAALAVAETSLGLQASEARQAEREDAQRAGVAGLAEQGGGSSGQVVTGGGGGSGSGGGNNNAEGLTYTSNIAKEMPKAVMYRLLAEKYKREGKSDLALEHFAMAADELMKGTKDDRSPSEVFRYSADAHLLARRVQKPARAFYRRRVGAATSIEAAFRGFQVRYEVVLKHRRLGWMQRKVSASVDLLTTYLLHLCGDFRQVKISGISQKKTRKSNSKSPHCIIPPTPLYPLTHAPLLMMTTMMNQSATDRAAVPQAPGAVSVGAGHTAPHRAREDRATAVAGEVRGAAAHHADPEHVPHEGGPQDRPLAPLQDRARAACAAQLARLHRARHARGHRRRHPRGHVHGGHDVRAPHSRGPRTQGGKEKA